MFCELWTHIHKAPDIVLHGQEVGLTGYDFLPSSWRLELKPWENEIHLMLICVHHKQTKGRTVLLKDEGSSSCVASQGVGISAFRGGNPWEGGHAQENLAPAGGDSSRMELCEPQDGGLCRKLAQHG